MRIAIRWLGLQFSLQVQSTLQQPVSHWKSNSIANEKCQAPVWLRKRSQVGNRVVDPSTDKDSEVHEGCGEVWTTQGIQKADTEKGHNVFKIVQVGSVRDDDMKFRISGNAYTLPSLLRQNTVLMDARVGLGWVGFHLVRVKVSWSWPETYYVTRLASNSQSFCLCLRGLQLQIWTHHTEQC